MSNNTYLDILNEELGKEDPQKALNTIVRQLSIQGRRLIEDLDTLNESKNRTLNTLAKARVLSIISQLKGFKNKKYSSDSERQEGFVEQQLLIGKLIVLSISINQRNKGLLNKIMTFM